jgi:predicted RNA-binding protein with PUA-like domain
LLIIRFPLQDHFLKFAGLNDGWMNYWLLKTEPETFSYDDLLREGQSHWDGVRNYAARNHLQAMSVGDRALIYYSGKDRAVVGVATVVASAYQDPTTDDNRWVAVGISPDQLLPRHVTLDEIKTDPALSEMVLLRISRLSVQPVSAAEFAHIIQLGGGKAHG